MNEKNSLSGDVSSGSSAIINSKKTKKQQSKNPARSTSTKKPKSSPSNTFTRIVPDLGWTGFTMLIIIACSIVYTLSNDTKLLSGPFMLDAINKLKENPEIRTIGSSLMNKRIGSEASNPNLNYNDPSRPLASLSFQLNYRYGGFDESTLQLDPTVFRITNFVLHALNAVLVGWIAHLLHRTLSLNIGSSSTSNNSGGGRKVKATATTGGIDDKMVAFATTALFAASPFNHSVASYTYARSDIMGATGTFLFVIFGLEKLLGPSLASSSSSSNSNSNNSFYAHSYDKQRKKFCFDLKMFIAIIFGLFSKQLTVIAPAVLLFIHLVLLELPWQRKKSSDGDSISIFASMANVLNSLIVTLYCHSLSFITIALYFITRLAKFGSIADLELITVNAVSYPCYLTNQPYAWFRYGATLFYPKGIALDHNLIQDKFCQTKETKVACVALFLVFCVMVVRTFNIARSATTSSASTSSLEQIILAGLGWFGLNILPSSVTITSDVYCERRAYAAGAGLYSAFVICMFDLLKKKKTSKASSTSLMNMRSIVYTSIIAALVGYFMITSLDANQNFYSSEALWRNVVSQYSDSMRGRNNLANSLSTQIQEQLLGCNSNSYATVDTKTCPAFNSTMYSEAESLYYSLLQSNPNDGYAMSGIARLHYLTGHAETAIQWWRKTAKADHMLAAEAYKMIGTQLHKTGKLDKAISEYNKAMDIAPDLNSELYNNLALAHLNSGKPQVGLKIFREGMRRFPDDKLLLSNKEIFENSSQASQSGGTPMDLSVQLFHQGVEHHLKGELDMAEKYYRKCLEVNSNPIPDVYHNLALILSGSDRLLEGRKMWLKGIEIDPENEQLKKIQPHIFRPY